MPSVYLFKLLIIIIWDNFKTFISAYYLDIQNLIPTYYLLTMVCRYDGNLIYIYISSHALFNLMLFEQILFVFEVFVDTNKEGLVIKMVKTQLLDPH